ncbi:hypothetical protein N44_01088 [Microcystis aeruginosa NIES-44]|uniref:Uncharacterized protein n=1 Tax=Microcystis aeruginosa NIES-44 TaxID=449439 RepID=A0A0A1VS28_MICAE|nr:hypothetical protein N44_01088 [Microcystis aeruginosa NIES-44]
MSLIFSPLAEISRKLDEFHSLGKSQLEWVNDQSLARLP